MPLRILVTGSAGFIGFHLARRLLSDGHAVVGVDGMTPYYDVRLKEARHAQLAANPAFVEARLMLEDAAALNAIADRHQPEAVVHLAAQAGVRYSLENPRAYVDSNLVGTFNVMEVARRSWGWATCCSPPPVRSMAPMRSCLSSRPSGPTIP